MKSLSAAAAALILAASTVSPAFAWGTSGHRTINHVAASALPSSLPAFVRTPAAVTELTTLGPEEDYLKDAGRAWDHDNDSGHFLSVGDDGTVAGVVRLDALPPTFDAYDAALRKTGASPFFQGYLPYEILEGWQQIRKDFALWRVDDYMSTHATTDKARAAFAADRTLRETLTLRDIGVWGHFVGDGSQPLHITVHYNGWGDYPNPSGFSTAHTVHSSFEGAFVRDHADAQAVAKAVPAYVDQHPNEMLTDNEMLAKIGGYLLETSRQVVPLYQLEKSGDFERATPAAVAFVDKQLARGAAEERDLIGLAWEDSLNATVSYPQIPVRDVLSGKVVPRLGGSD